MKSRQPHLTTKEKFIHLLKECLKVIIQLRNSGHSVSSNRLSSRLMDSLLLLNQLLIFTLLMFIASSKVPTDGFGWTLTYIRSHRIHSLMQCNQRIISLWNLLTRRQLSCRKTSITTNRHIRQTPTCKKMKNHRTWNSLMHSITLSFESQFILLLIVICV